MAKPFCEVAGLECARQAKADAAPLPIGSLGHIRSVDQSQRTTGLIICGPCVARLLQQCCHHYGSDEEGRRPNGSGYSRLLLFVRRLRNRRIFHAEPHDVAANVGRPVRDQLL